MQPGELLAQPTIYFAGLSYLGEAKHAKANYPVVTSINVSPGKGQAAPLDKAFRTMLEQTAGLPYKIAAGEKGDYESGPAIAMTLAIERETVSVDKFPDYYKLVAEISAQILFFDFQSMRLIASIPLDIARNDVVSVYDDLALAKETNVKALYQPDNSDINLFTIARDRILESHLPEEDALRFKVDTLSFGDKAAPLLPPSLAVNPLSQTFGQYFTAQLAQNARLNMVPYTKGYAIGNKMSGRMSNGDVYQLALPEPDYVFDLTVTNFKVMKKTNKNLYAARVLLNAREATDTDLLINDYFHYAVPMLVSKNQSSETDWPGYEDALEMLLLDIAHQLKAPEKKWFDTHTQQKRKTYQTFTAWSEQFNEM
ncbi:hypothetical protein [Alteromonas lipolytica]|uniref:Uncharacterized protein n=1 Tax=Alteromonas lipolytica TaxID=1856405 RepID=A0A1E8FBG2_9ALTE|nr:hypothetical protein [Alteromonas lipolytica]OFI32948.1 hypothetical protein BFC17_01335 [Alteromonas lipolytica]GGF63976.1 hypothetical protein GCM10011338_15410 [Alteromonas lipolytica]